MRASRGGIALTSAGGGCRFDVRDAAIAFWRMKFLFGVLVAGLAGVINGDAVPSASALLDLCHVPEEPPMAFFFSRHSFVTDRCSLRNKAKKRRLTLPQSTLALTFSSKRCNLKSVCDARFSASSSYNGSRKGNETSATVSAPPERERERETNSYKLS